MHRRLTKPFLYTFAAEAPSEGGTDAGDTSAGDKQEGKDQSFTQADVDRIVADRLKREREKFADYADLKKKAEGAKTAEERMAELEKEIAATKHEALRRRVQAAHGISDEDADLFLTGTDEESLTAQAKRLADRESERKKKNNVSPREGNTTTATTTDARRAWLREHVRSDG